MGGRKGGQTGLTSQHQRELLGTAASTCAGAAPACSLLRAPKPPPRECSNTLNSVQKTASWGTEVGEICLAVVAAQTGGVRGGGGRKNISNSEDKSCTAVTGELCYARLCHCMCEQPVALFPRLAEIYSFASDSDGPGASIARQTLLLVAVSKSTPHNSPAP